MSREVLGLAPADAGDVATPAGAPTRAAAVWTAPPPARRSWPALAVAVVLGAAGGWLLAGTAQTGNITGQAPGISAQAVDSRADLASSRPVTGTLRVRLTNAGSRQVRLTGYDASVSAARIAELDLRSMPDGVLPGGSTRRLDVRVSVGCEARLPLDLPSLRMRLADGAQRPLSVVGANSALAELCDARVGSRLLESDGRAHRDRQFYGVLLRAPSGRLTRIHEVRAAGFALSLTPRPAMVGRDGLMVWLNPPGGCPRSWRNGGFPSALDIEVDLPAGERATVPVEVGPALADWLLSVCGRSA